MQRQRNTVPITIVAAIMRNASYYDTLKIGTLNKKFYDILQDQNFWKEKIVAEKNLSLSSINKKKVDIQDWHDFYRLITDNIGGQSQRYKQLNHIIYNILELPQVTWVRTHKLELHSTLLDDELDETWTRTLLNSPIKFIRQFDDNGHNIFIITEENEIYVAKSANRAIYLLFSLTNINDKYFGLSAIMDASYNPDNSSLIIYAQDNGKQIIKINLSLEGSQGIIDWQQRVSKSVPIFLLDGNIITHLKENIDSSNRKVRRYTVSSESGTEDIYSGRERIKDSGLLFPTQPFITIEKAQQLPETPVEIQAINTADAFRAIDRIAGADYDIDTQHDIRSEFEDTNQSGLIDMNES